MNDSEADWRLADDQPITYLVATVDGKQYRWTGTASLLNASITIRSGPMLLLCDDNVLLNFAHVISLTPIGEVPASAS